MFRKKQQKRIVELNPAEVRLMLKALMNFRNKAMNAGKHVISEVLPCMTTGPGTTSAPAYRPRI